jgi:hypothetical protein
MEVSKVFLAPRSLTLSQEDVANNSNSSKEQPCHRNLLLFRRVDRLLALYLRAVVDTVPLLVVLEAKSLMLLSLTLKRGKSTCDDAEIRLVS